MQKAARDVLKSIQESFLDALTGEEHGGHGITYKTFVRPQLKYCL